MDLKTLISLRIWILIMNATAVLTHLLPQGNKRKGADIA